MPTNKDEKKSQARKIAKIFNFVGGTLIFLGISYLLFNNWDVLATLGRILATLGVACWSLLFAVSLTKKHPNSSLSGVFFILGGLLLPLGLSVTINASLPHPSPDLANFFFTADVTNILITAICFCVFVLLQLRIPREILLLFCILFGSMFFISCTNLMNSHLGWLSMDELKDYQTLLLGLCYLLLGYGVSFKDNELTGPLYFFGDLLILGACFHLGGLGLFFNGTTHLFWEVMAPILVLLSFILAIPLKSKSLLYVGAIFLVIYISKINEKFAYLFGTLGWPMLLITVGIFLMFLGYLFVSTQNKNHKK